METQIACNQNTSQKASPASGSLKDVKNELNRYHRALNSLKRLEIDNFVCNGDTAWKANALESKVMPCEGNIDSAASIPKADPNKFAGTIKVETDQDILNSLVLCPEAIKQECAIDEPICAFHNNSKVASTDKTNIKASNTTEKPPSLFATTSQSALSDVPDLSMIMPMVTALMEEVKKLHSKVDLILSNTGIVDRSTNLPSNYKLQVIRTVDELKEFNDKLKSDEDLKALLIPYFHSLCDKKEFASKSTPGECALSFWVDFIFTRELFTQCSWAGGSRDKNCTKIAFKQFENVINFLMDLARTVDPSYTLVATQNLVKSLLQYAKRRSATEPIRRSAPKCRPKTGRTPCRKKRTVDDKCPKADEFEDDENEDSGDRNIDSQASESGVFTSVKHEPPTATWLSTSTKLGTFSPIRNEDACRDVENDQVVKTEDEDGENSSGSDAEYLLPPKFGSQQTNTVNQNKLKRSIAYQDSDVTTAACGTGAKRRKSLML